jgi:L-amino acid N-acyltransferase YncA
MIIRDANIDDVVILIELGKILHNESDRYRNIKFSEEKAFQVISNLINMDNGIVVVAEDHNGIVGMIGGMVGEHFFSHDLYACEFSVYVHPNKRGAMASVRMIKEFERQAIALGAKEMVLGISTDIDVDRTSKLYGKLGYKQYGVTTIKRF